MKTKAWSVLIISVALLYANEAFSQDTVIELYDGPAPGSENWDWQESFVEQANMAYNIVSPTLTVYQANKEIATGKAVIICPGGGFHFLSMESEGYSVAEWLQEKGITAFVLKYRTEHCQSDNPMQEFMQKKPNSDEFNKNIKPIVAMGIADGTAAIAYVREHAVDFGIRKGQIGIMGFSAGGTVTSGVVFKFDESKTCPRTSGLTVFMNG